MIWRKKPNPVAVDQPAKITPSAVTDNPPQVSSRTEGVVDGTTDAASFIAQLKARPQRTSGGRGRLVFAMDATMSRQPTWDMALSLQADMFEAVRDVGGLDVQLVYFRGIGECRSSKWVSDPSALARLMSTVSVQGGRTQIGRVLNHTRKETETKRVHALVFVGDAMEENVDELCGRAGELAVLGVPMFLFQEGHDQHARQAFAELARITKGAHCSFDEGSAGQLRALLQAVAVYAAGGRAALQDMSTRGNDGARLLIEKMK